MLGGLAAIAAVPIVGAVGGVGLGDGFVAIVVLATVAFVAPAAILSAVAPMIVRATLTDVATSGSTVGRLSAIGTVGAIMVKQQLWTIAICLGVIVGTGVMLYRFLQPML